MDLGSNAFEKLKNILIYVFEAAEALRPLNGPSDRNTFYVGGDKIVSSINVDSDEFGTACM